MAQSERPDGGSVRIRTLMAAYRMDDPPARLVVESPVRLYRAGSLLYAWGEDAAKLWGWLQSGTFWHDMSAQRHRLVIHRDTAADVVDACLDRGETLVIC